MSYQAGEAAILTLIQALDAYSATNTVSLANDANRKIDSLLNSGASYRYVALKPGTFNRQVLDIGETVWQTAWQTVVCIYVLNTTRHGPEKVLVEERQTIMDKLAAYYTLNNASDVVGIDSMTGGEIAEYEVASDTFIKQEIVISWVEVTEVTQND